MKNNRYYFALLALMICCSLFGCGDYIEGITPDAPEATIVEKNGIQVKTSSLQFEATGATIGMELRVVGSKWKVFAEESCDWVEKISPAEGEAGNNIVGITLKENSSDNDRTAYVVVKHIDSGDTVHVAISQYTYDSKFSRRSDSLALLAIYSSLSKNGDWRKPWDPKTPITTWNGLTFEEVRGEQRVSEMSIREMPLSGEIPNELGNLRELKKLAIGAGSINGRIPNTIASLRKLEEMSITLPTNSAQWDLPDNIGNMKALKTINLGVTKVNAASCKGLYEATSLESITMQAAEGAFPAGIATLVNLKTLNLSSTFSGPTSKVTELPEDLGSLAQLKTLNLQMCTRLLRLPETIGDLTNLTSLTLAGVSGMESLPESFGKLSKITNLNLQNCYGLVSLPNSIGDMTQLTGINLTSCRALRTLPESFSKLSKITSLTLSDCNALTSLPASIGDMTQLTSISLECKVLESLPESFGRLVNLSSLTLTNCNKLNNLPENFGSLTNLRTFTVTIEGTMSLPSSFGQLANLQTFNCSKWSADGSAGVQGDFSIFKTLPNLTTLKASYNSLSGDLANLAECPNLTTIELVSSNLSGTLDLGVILTDKTISLDLSKNNLSGTLDGMTRGTAMKTLKLANNKISGTLPNDIDKCSNLVTLDLQNNLLTGTLPVALLRITTLSNYGLMLKNNNMSGSIAPEILNSPQWKKWYLSYITPQNPGYGFEGF